VVRSSAPAGKRSLGPASDKRVALIGMPSTWIAGLELAQQGPPARKNASQSS